MELLKRQDVNASKDIIKLGREIKREFLLSTSVIEFSLIVPLETLKSIDYFTVKFNQIKDIKYFDDIKSIENDLFRLKSLEVMTVHKDENDEDFAKLTYRGIPNEYELIRLSFDNDCYLNAIIDTNTNPYIIDSHNSRYLGRTFSRI